MEGGEEEGDRVEKVERVLGKEIRGGRARGYRVY
jgi:hypothetical protein